MPGYVPATALFLLTVVFPGISQAEKLSVDAIRSAVQTWVRGVTADARPDAVVEKMQPYIVDGEIMAYIAHLGEGGFCLCGADDLVLPVYLYAPTGEYDPKVPGYQSILEEIAIRKKNLATLILQKDAKSIQLQDELAQRALFWKDLIAQQPVLPAGDGADPALRNDSGPQQMELDLTSKWRQESPYNDQCPILTPSTDEHCMVGCNATAAAQVMYYWKWPDSGVGTGQTTYNVRYRTTWAGELLSFDPGIPEDWAGGNRLRWKYDFLLSNYFLEMNGYWDENVHAAAKQDGSITAHDNPVYQAALDNLYYNKMTAQPRVLSVDFGTANYNWSLMQDIHSDPPDAGDIEVAKLCYHVGVASESAYGIWSTSAIFSHPDPSHGDTSGALRDHFRYDEDIFVYSERNAETIHYLSEEIQWLRPVLLGGSNSNGEGHAYVVYGYNKGTDPDREFLVNMGWGPGNDDHTWYSLDTTPFPLKQDHMIYIAPRDMVKFVGAADSGDGSPADPYLDLEEALVSAPNGARLIFKADSFNTYSGSELLLEGPLTLSGHDVVIGK